MRQEAFISMLALEAINRFIDHVEAAITGTGTGS